MEQGSLLLPEEMWAHPESGVTQVFNLAQRLGYVQAKRAVKLCPNNICMHQQTAQALQPEKDDTQAMQEQNCAGRPWILEKLLANYALGLHVTYALGLYFYWSSSRDAA